MAEKTSTRAKTKTTKTAKPKRSSAASSAAKATSVVKPKPKAGKYDMLRKLNLVFGLVLVLQAVAIIVFGGSQTVPLTTQYPARDALMSEVAGHEVYAAAARQVADVHLSWIVAKFLLLFALVYLAAATLWRRKYEAWLDRGVNKLRWAGFGVAGGAMTATIAVLGGVTDWGYLLLFFGSTALAAVCALALELLGRGRRLSRLLTTGAVVGLVLPWLIFIGGIVGAWMYDGALPAYLYYVYASMFLFYLAVALGTYMRVMQRGKWAHIVNAEWMFMTLGFVGATILAWQIFVGAL